MMLTAAPEAWPTYPLCLPRGDVDANDLAQYHADLNARAPYLFAADEANCHVELCTYTAGRPPPPNDTAGAEAAGVGAGGGNTFNQAPGAWTSKGKFSAPVCVYTAEGLRSVLAVRKARAARSRWLWLTLQPDKTTARSDAGFVSKHLPCTSL